MVQSESAGNRIYRPALGQAPKLIKLIITVSTSIPVVIFKAMNLVKVVKGKWDTIKILATNFTDETFRMKAFSCGSQNL